MNFEVHSNFLYFLSMLRICMYVPCYWSKHFISCDKNYEFITRRLRSLKYFEEEVKRIVWIKERLPWAERLDHLQSVFDFCLFAAVVVHVTERWSPIKQYSLSSLDILVKLIHLTASFGYVDTAWKSAGLLDVGLLWSPLITTPCCNHIKFSFDLDEWMLKTSCMNL